MRVLLTFLGLGSRVPPTTTTPEDFVYSPAVYRLGGKLFEETRYIQKALLDALCDDGQRPDKVLLAMTEQSEFWHWEREGRLKSLVEQFNIETEAIRITDALDSKSQWETFEKILSAVPAQAELYVDITHGFRLMPVLFSAAINFLMNSKGVRLAGVYYGAFEPRKEGPFDIVEVSDFYRVNQWADAVKTLVSTGDARPLVAVAEEAPAFQAGGLNDPELASALQRLSLLVRNVDANLVPDAARHAMAQIRRVQSSSAGGHATSTILLSTLDQQFRLLATPDPLTGRYDHAYFRSQLALVAVLNEYQLFMQSFTILRELIGSVGVLAYPKYRDGKKLIDARKYADLFVNMCQFDEKWTAQNADSENMAKNLLPFVARLKSEGLWAGLARTTDRVVHHRNAFDHARMGPKVPRGDDVDLAEVAVQSHGELAGLIDRLESLGVFPAAR